MGFRGTEKVFVLGLAVITMWTIAGSAQASIDFHGQSRTEHDAMPANDDDVAIGPDGSAYVLSVDRWQVVRFGSDGSRMGHWDVRGRYPTALAIDPAGNIAVAVGHRIERYTADGRRLRPWFLAFGKNSPSDVSALEFASDGTLYLLDWLDSRVVRVSSEGRYLGGFGGSGAGDGDLFLPSDIAVGSDGRVYVVDDVLEVVQVFGAKGKFLGQWGDAGLGHGDFWESSTIAADDAGHLYVGDETIARVQVFDLEGRYLDQIGSRGGAAKRFQDLSRLAATGSGDFIASDKRNGRIQRFRYHEGRHVPQAQIYFSARRWPIEATPGRGVRLPMTISSFGSLPARDLKICPVRNSPFSKRVLRGVRCHKISAVAPGETRKFGVQARMPLHVSHGKFRSLRFSVRSLNAGSGPLGLTLYSGHDFSWFSD